MASYLENKDEETLISLAEHAKDYAVFKGILMRLVNSPYNAAVPLPFCLIPSEFPSKWFSIACDLQPYMNLILLKVSFDKMFLKEALANTIEADEFVSNIFRIYETVEDQNTDDEEPLSLGVIRTDYLLDSDASGSVTGIKQVESNTISVSFGGMAPRVLELHKYTLTKLGMHDRTTNLPANNSTNDLAKGLVAAWEAYGSENAVILVVIEEILSNVYDQKALEFAVFDMNNHIKIVRRTFQELGSSIYLKNKALMINDELEVAVVYYRTGYVPEQYKPEDWETRLLMERSKAVKCPTAGMQLAGTKRVQLQLTKPGVLEKFVSTDLAEKIRQVFVQMYSLEQNDEGNYAVSLAMKNYDQYVLKPEREGGGCNIYGSKIKAKLESIISSDERKAYILMERIHPSSNLNCIVSYNTVPEVQNIACELGTFGVILGNKKSVLVNSFAGHLLRSKLSSFNETGIVAGFGALDSPFLVQDF